MTQKMYTFLPFCLSRSFWINNGLYICRRWENHLTFTWTYKSYVRVKHTTKYHHHDERGYIEPMLLRLTPKLAGALKRICLLFWLRSLILKQQLILFLSISAALFNQSSGEFDLRSFEPVHEISNNVVCATSKGSDQPAHTRSLIRAFASR